MQGMNCMTVNTHALHARLAVSAKKVAIYADYAQKTRFLKVRLRRAHHVVQMNNHLLRRSHSFIATACPDTAQMDPPRVLHVMRVSIRWEE